MKLTVDELEERAASLDDLAAHPAWATLVEAIEQAYGEKNLVTRLGIAAGPHASRSAEAIALLTVERLAEHRVARHIQTLPQVLADTLRSQAKRARTEAEPHQGRSLGPHVEMTTGR